MTKTMENFGKYVLLEKLAAGGMAEVFLAKSTGAEGISRFVAIKRILPQYSENPEFIEMFKEEAKIAVNLNHSNVVSIFDFGLEKSQFYLVMEFVEGQNLRQILNHLKKESKIFSVDQIVFIVKEVAAGLDHAHRCLDGATGKPLNITHRDMSPQNIMVSFEGEVKIVDFGIAKAENQLEQTRAGTIKGKFGYMSPEQADGQIVDLRTDVFSLGIVLWELLTGDRLFTSNSEAGTLKKIRECVIPPLRKINPSIPPELERICIKALAKDKSLRYQTAAAFHRDLNRFLNTQYPEFSAHDFSVFMKSAYSQMFIENRKKLIEYAKVQGIVDVRVEKDAVVKTESITLSQPHKAIGLMDGNDVINESEIVLDPKAKKVNLSEKKIGAKNPLRHATMAHGAESVFIHPHRAGTSSGVRSGTQIGIGSRVPKRRSSPLGLGTYLMIPLLIVGAFFGWTHYVQPNYFPEVPSLLSLLPFRTNLTPEIPPATTKLEPMLTVESQGTFESASKQMGILMIESSPIGARVFINDSDTGMLTPVRQHIEINKRTKIVLRKEGFLPYEKELTLTEMASSFKGTLQPAPEMGYVSLNVVNGGANAVITINGQRLSEKPPLKLYGIPANKPVKVIVEDAFAQLRAEQTITVRSQQKIQLNMILSRIGQANEK